MHQQYRNYGPPQPSGRPAHVPAPRRGGIGPMMTTGPGPHAVPYTPAQMAQQQQQQEYARDQAKRRSRKPTDKNLPDGVVETLVDSEMGENHNKLRNFERRLDATMMRKRLDIIDSFSRNTKRYRTLRIWITNEVEDQNWQGNINMDSFDFSANLESSYRVKIEGRLLDDEDGEDENEAAKDDDKGDGGEAGKPASSKVGDRYRFSHFFKALSVDFDRTRTGSRPDTVVEWKKPDRTPAGTNLPASADFDEFTFKRNGDENVNITINLVRHEDPERFTLSRELFDVVDLKEATRAEVVFGIWNYVKLKKLQEEEEKRNFRCDELLRKVVGGRETGFMPHVQDYITPHLTALPPVKLAYTIRLDAAFHANPVPTIYDVRVAVDDPLRAKLVPFIHNASYAAMLKDVAGLDEQLATLVQAVANSKAKHAFLTALADDPVGFMRAWLSSQHRDLEIIMGDAPRGGGEDAAGDEWRKGGRASIWASQNARETVNHAILSKQPLHR